MDFFSATTLGFYRSDVHGDAMPEDAVAITEAEKKALIDGQDAGKRIAADAQGRPTLADRNPPGPPKAVTRFQALAALHLAGHLEAVKAIIAAPETPVLAKLAWDNALTFERNSPTLATLATALGLSSSDLDALFITAAGIEA